MIAIAPAKRIVLFLRKKTAKQTSTTIRGRPRYNIPPIEAEL